MKLRALLMVSVVAFVACGGDDNSLGGSIEESFTLGFDRVAVRKISTDLVIEYLKDVGDPPDKVCKLVIDTENLPLADETNVSGDTFKQRVTIERIAGSGGDFPALTSGKVHFDVFSFTAGGRVDGEFDGVFTNGRTIHGTFDGKVEEVSLD